MKSSTSAPQTWEKRRLHNTFSRKSPLQQNTTPGFPPKLMLGFTLPLQLRCCQHLSQQPPLPSPISPKPFYPPVVPSAPRPRIGPGLRASFPVLSGSVFPEDEPDVELGRLLSLLPEEMRRRVSDHAELPQLIEVVMDLGRKPLARFPSGDFVISEYPITVQDIEHATAQVLQQ